MIRRKVFLYSLLFFKCLGVSALYAETSPEKAGFNVFRPRILIVENNEQADELERQGVIFWHRRADMALALVPIFGPGYSSASTEVIFDDVRRAIPMMDKAKEYFNADNIHSGRGLSHSYTGKGVVVGFHDMGFDPNHANFKDGSGECRVKRIFNYDATENKRDVVDSPDRISQWKTDNPNSTHATNVAGILTGSFDINGFAGMAPEAEIVATTSRLSEVEILMGCEDIINYANSVGKPAVINLSIGNYNGPHDGSSLFSKYLDLMGEEAIICVAAGNEGNSTNSLRHTFNDKENVIRLRVHPTDGSQFNMSGITDVWSADSQPVGIRLLVYDTRDKRAVYESDIYGLEGCFDKRIYSHNDSELARYFTGTFILKGYISELNGRWISQIQYSATTGEQETGSSSNHARYNIGLELTADPGTHIDVTSDAESSLLATWPGNPEPGPSLSVSDMATGRNVICVGMYTNRSSVPTIAGDTRALDDVAGTINIRSGYGTLTDGRILPDVVAPGGWVISSTSSSYASAHPEEIPAFCDMQNIDGKTYYWDVNCGTSMSCPYTAGAIALWLEANPALSVNDIKEILNATNHQNVPDIANPRHGGGWLDAYEGLKYVIRNTDAHNALSVSRKLSTMIIDNRIEILNPAGIIFHAEIISADGNVTMKYDKLNERISELDITDLKSGLYILRLSDGLNIPTNLKFIR